MEDYSTQIIDYLLTQSWQIGILVVVIAIANLALKNKSAHVRYLLWLIVLAKCFVPPLLTIPLAVLPENETMIVSPPFEPTEPIVVESVARTSTAEAPLSPAPVILSHTPKITISQLLALAWIIGLSVFVLAAAAKALRTEFWLRRERKSLSAGLQSEIEELFSGFSVRISPKVWLVEGIGQPFVWGLVRGNIYLPANFIKINSTEHRRSVLGHEISHVLRFDAAVNLLQVVVQAIFWFHPLVWWSNRKIRAEREKCCDEMVVARLNTTVKDYSKAIIDTLVNEYESTRSIPSLAIAGPVKNIEERIKTMLRPGKKFYKRPSVVVAMFVLALALITVPTALVLTARAATEIDLEPPHGAVTAGNIAAVEQWLVQGGDVNVKNADGETLLRRALLKGRLDIVQLLEKHGADVDAEIQKDPSLIRRVALLGKLDQVKAYIESGSQQVSVSDKNQILRWAITGGHVDIMEYILDHGADIKGWNFLEIAVRLNRKQILELLIAKGADPNPGGVWSPLHITLYHYPRLEMAKILLSHGADPYKERGRGAWNPMHYAIDKERQDMVELFLGHRRDKDLLPYVYYAMTENHKDVVPLFEPYVSISPIHLSCFYGKLDDVKSYLEQGKDIEAQDIGGLSLLQFAVVGCQIEIVDYLIAQGCNVNSKASDGATALHHAANGNGKGEEMVQRLIAAGALVDAKDNTNCTPFLYSMSGLSGDLEAAKILLKHGADINIQRKSDEDTTLQDAARGNNIHIHGMAHGVTALHDAARRGNLERAKWLIDKGADVNRGAKDGNTPLGVAINRNRLDVVKYLIEHGADINCRDEWGPQGQTPLHYAAERGRKEIAEMLINKGADINSLDKNGRTPLQIAVRSNNKEIVEILLIKDADITVQDSSGRTATGTAIDRGYTEIVELLRKNGAKE